MRISIYAGDRTELDKRFQEIMRNVKGNRSEFVKRAVVEHCSTEKERSEVDELRKRVEELEEMVRKEMKAVVVSGEKVMKPTLTVERQKTDWEELAEECRAFAKRTNLTSEEIEKIKADVRKRLNACSC